MAMRHGTRRTLLSGQAAAVAPAFSPLSLSPVLWLKADGTLWQNTARTTPAVADGDPVGCWDDLSGNGNNVTQGTTAKKPTLKLAVQNGLPAVRFDGVSNFLRTAPYTLNQPYTVYVVFSFRSLVAGSSVMDGGALNSALMYDASGNGSVYVYDGGSVGPTATGGGWRAITGAYNTGSSSVRRNASTPATGTLVGTAAGRTIIGCRADTTSNPGTIDVGELVIAPGAVSPGNDASMLAYLNSRWAIY